MSEKEKSFDNILTKLKEQHIEEIENLKWLLEQEKEIKKIYINRTKKAIEYIEAPADLTYEQRLKLILQILMGELDKKENEVE